ncbi:response regulator transcription factor [Pedobacter caeni]|uniref:Two component transcriptional regulator, LuxR family n=1 Tax=Pedobacter caeni TaxID=288992 RepID=A0A1M5K1A1_9SPHI|nr:response regulator transcription factor [Pedobacter caeni]SHG46093.1 two component transcriptional regulator, LuxR family [Pedobacter caeni]
MDKKTIPIAIIDDHTLFRQGLISLLAEFPEVDIVFDAANGEEMIEKLNKHPIPEVILMDISMPVIDGYEATLWLKQQHPEIRVLALSMFEEDKPIIKMLKNGAGGYLLKESRTSDLVNAIKIINQQGYYLNDLVSGKLLKSIQNEHMPPLSNQLSANEMKFLQLCCSELTYKEIADQMNLSPHTIDNYRQELFQKFDLKSRTGLVLFAIKQELIDLSQC